MIRLFAIFLCMLPVGKLLADGYPFDHLTHEIVGANLRLPLTDDQQTEVASTGRITFTTEQLGLLRMIYPKIPTKLRVIASTINDGLDVRDPNPVDCIWTTPTEIGVTIFQKDDDGDYTFNSGDGEVDHTVTALRISPTGLLYHQGKEISVERAFEMVRTAKKSDGSPDSEQPLIVITQPPPFKSSDEEEVANNKKAADLFVALAKYGESVKVTVYPTW